MRTKISQPQSVFLVLLSGIGVDGVLCQTGDIVEVDEHEAKNLLGRSKARLATAADMPEGHDEDQDEADQAEAEQE